MSAVVSRAAAGPDLEGRVLGLDVFRGVLIAAVVVLDVVGTRDHPHLAHAAWNGYTVTDLVFPALVTVSGVGLAFLLRPPTTVATIQRLVRRTIALLLVGVVLYNNLGSLDLSEARYTGVLQTFAVSGLAASSVILILRPLLRGDRWWAGAALTLGGLWWYQGRFLAAAEASGCLAAGARCSPFHDLDVAWLGADHVYRAGQAGWDPEGIVPSLAATILVLGGWSVGVLLRDHGRRAWLAPLGLVVAAGGLLALVVPALADNLEVNKRLHTPAFQALVLGYSLLALAAAVTVFDWPAPGRAGTVLSWARRGLAWPLETLGRNPLITYLLAHLIGAAAAANTRPEGGTWRAWLTDRSVAVTNGPLWGDPLFNDAFTLLTVMFVVTVGMRLLRWRVTL